ncbi:hypothetical protein A8144_00550 [Mycobacterium leprae 3125609]|nr:hypothetical protein A8144_00550 [Mycobacterium leprae 3125609]OAX72270.1 hypothetical protein A3216_00610 [Mycobacterium leprae 7935681]
MDDGYCGRKHVLSDPGQPIILGAHPDGQETTAYSRAKRRVQTTGGHGDHETTFGYQRLRLGTATALGERQLQLSMNCVRQIHKIGTTTPHSILDVGQTLLLWAPMQYRTDLQLL